MMVEMWDMDVPVEIKQDTNAEGVDFIRIHSTAGDESTDICLTREMLDEFIDALRFIGKRLK